MKWIVFLITLVMFSRPCFSQSHQVRLTLSSGMSSYYGSSTSRTFSCIRYDFAGICQNSPYGRRSGLSYVIGVKAAEVSKNHMLLQYGLSFENLVSEADFINTFASQVPDVPGTATREGKVTLRNQFISTGIFFGRRMLIGTFPVDLLVGSDFAYRMKGSEKTTFPDDVPMDVKITKNTSTLDFDIRPGVHTCFHYKNFGLEVGYALGVVNYNPGNNQKAFSRFLEIGTSLKIH